MLHISNHNTYQSVGLHCFITCCRLLDDSSAPAGDTTSVSMLESVNADKSLWCRLNLSLIRLMSYVLLAAVGRHISMYSTGSASFNYIT